jgi:hypothetical protein
MAYALNIKAGAKDITVSLSSAPTSQWLVEAIEYSSTGTPAFDTAGNIDNTTTCTSCSGVGLTLTGTNDVIVQAAVCSACNSITSPYTNPADIDTFANAEAGAVNVSSGAAPTWKQSPKAPLAGSALALKDH